MASRETKPIRIIVTGEHDDLIAKFPTELGFHGTPLEWVPLPVLSFERLKINGSLLQKIIDEPFDWIVFTSQRAVHFWTELLVDEGHHFPPETHVACIGAKTAEAANNDGFTPDFCPSSPGTETFLAEFDVILDNSIIKPSILLPMAENGRKTIAEHLAKNGCRVQVLPLYRTRPREDIGRHLTQEDLNESSMVLFTSPSSVDAFTKHFAIPEGVRVASIGRFTAEHMERKGFENVPILPKGDFERIGEILC